MPLYKIQKKVLSVAPHAVQFLNGLTSNSLDKPQNAFFNIHGRIIATFYQIRMSDDEFLIVIETAYVEMVLHHTERYALLSKTRVIPRTEHVYFDVTGDAALRDVEWAIPQKKGQLIISPENRFAPVSEKDFTLFRLQNGIPLLGVDYHDELLLNVSEKDFVSFTKGCYLGQEPISKVHNRSKPTWILRVKYEEECSDEERGKLTSKAVDPESSRIFGFVFVKNN